MGLVEVTARVERVETDALWVRTETGNACGHCSASGCGVSTLSGFFGTRRNRLRLEPVAGIRTGDRVVIGIADSALTRAAMWAYLWPLIAMILAAVGAGAAGLTEGATALLSVAGLLLGLVVSRLLTAGGRGMSRYRPHLLRQVTEPAVEVHLSEEKTS